MQTTIRLNSRNQITLPREVCKAMHVTGNDELLVVVKGNVTVIMPKPTSYREALAGAGIGVYTKTYLNKERRAW